MKKSVVFLSAFLCACSGLVERKPETKYLTQLKDEPVGCVYLYRLEVDTLVYDKEDAIAYLENRIVDQARKGNTYWLVSIRTNPKEFKFFGQERSYVIVANVYRCPEHATIVTKSEVETSSEYQQGFDW
jgi:hypothetical protein